MATWYYSKGDQAFGPVEQEQIAPMVAQGLVAGEDLVWTEGMAEWQPARTIFGGILAGAGGGAGPGAVGGVAAVPMAEVAGGGAGGSVGTLGYHNPLVDQRFAYAGFWVRFCAAIVDAAILWVAQLTLLLGLTALGGGRFLNVATGRPVTRQEVSLALLYNLFGWLVPCAYEVAMIAACGATVGKMAMGIKVVRANGEAVGVGRSIGRYFAKLLSSLLLCVGYIMVAFTERKQGLHDIICETVVIRTR
jgi:uncharacterized RDD family membrane protein YckC